MQRTRHPLDWALPAVLIASAVTPLLAHAQSAAQTANGPYIGIEGGLNWELPQNYRVDGTIIDRLHFDRSWAAGLIGGYSFANGLRPELEVDRRRNALSYDNEFGAASGHDNATSAMANLWYDFKARSGLLSVLHPYLGGGAGAMRSWYGAPMLGPDAVASDYATEFAYQVGGGVGFDLTRNLTLSLDYRRLWALRGSFHDTFATLPPDESLHQRYVADTALLSVRYTFGQVQSVAITPPPPPPPPAPPPEAQAQAAPPPPPPVAATPPPCQPPAGFQVDANCHIIDQTIVVRAVDFEFDSAKLTDPAQQTLDQVAASLARQPTLHIEIRGYTDSQGSADYNLHLSQRRADAVKNYLVGKGVDGDALQARGYGKVDPIASNATAQGRAENRRVAFVVTDVPEHVRISTQNASPASTEAAEQGGSK
jgi:OOP family OmpA-OmpF porin